MKTLALAAVAVTLSAAAGCSDTGAGGAMNNPSKTYTKEERLAATAARGYQELRRDNVIYVVSTHDAVRRVKGGKDPVMKVSAIGFGPPGEKVIFEASKDGLENSLMREFERRHTATAQAS